MPKSYISALGFSTGHSVAADSITLDGLFFTALLPDQEHKHLGVRMTMTGNFEVEQEYVWGEMQRRLESLNAKVLSRVSPQRTVHQGWYYYCLSLHRLLGSMVPVKAEQYIQDVVYWI